ncbi:MAG: DUF2190 family protein [Hahellaceae bacterium]|nr:DUF2190 family protein [Hahellaceae bacterium]
MATNYIQGGAVMDYVNNTGSDIASGDVVVIKNLIGVSLTDIPNTTPNSVGAVAIDGVYEVPKVSGAVFVQGEKLIYDVSAGAFDDSAATPAAGDVSGCCVAMAAGANGETTCKVKLNVGVGTVA